MTKTQEKRIVEIRLIVIVCVNVRNAELLDRIGSAIRPSSVRDIVSSEVTSNLESVPYVEAVIVSQL
jgi:hypothetical protein